MPIIMRLSLLGLRHRDPAKPRVTSILLRHRGPGGTFQSAALAAWPKPGNERRRHNKAPSGASRPGAADGRHDRFGFPHSPVCSAFARRYPNASAASPLPTFCACLCNPCEAAAGFLRPAGCRRGPPLCAAGSCGLGLSIGRGSWCAAGGRA